MYQHLINIWTFISSEYGKTKKILEVLHSSKFPAKSWQNPASIEGEEQNKKKIVPTWDWTTTHNLQIIGLMLCQLCCLCLLSVSIIKAFKKSCSIDSRNEQSQTCEVVHETKLTSQISNRFLANTVDRAWNWWSGCCGFNPGVMVLTGSPFLGPHGPF